MGRGVGWGLVCALALSMWSKHTAAGPSGHDVAPVRHSECPTVEYTVHLTPGVGAELPALQVELKSAPKINKGGFPVRPTVFALMVTGGDRAHEFAARKSMESFAEQTQAKKVLLIINDSPSYSLLGSVSPWLQSATDTLFNDNVTCVTEVRLPPNQYTPSQLRNLAIGAVPSLSYWLLWEETAWHERQFVRLVAERLKMVGAHVMSITNQYRFLTSLNSSYLHVEANGLPSSTMVFKTKATEEAGFDTTATSANDASLMASWQNTRVKMATWDNPPWLDFAVLSNSDPELDAGEKLDVRDTWCMEPSTKVAACASALATELHMSVTYGYKDWDAVVNASLDENLDQSHKKGKAAKPGQGKTSKGATKRNGRSNKANGASTKTNKKKSQKM